jgi:hypothetical protein
VIVMLISSLQKSLFEEAMSVADLFGLLNGITLVLFVAVLVVIFVYEYESLRRERS